MIGSLRLILACLRCSRLPRRPSPNGHYSLACGTKQYPYYQELMKMFMRKPGHQVEFS